MTATCTIEDCESEARARGFCMRHYKKARQEGLPLVRFPDRVCGVDGCDKPHHAKDMCTTHFLRMRRRGDLDVDIIVGDDHRRLLSYVPKLPEWQCWEWLGYRDANGYGRITVNNYATRAYREMYVATFGPIEDGLYLDHLCRNPPCVNPWHLEPVTNVENIMRGDGPTAVNARKTHCHRGHEFTPENTYIIPTTGSRSCRTCKKLHWSRGRVA